MDNAEAKLKALYDIHDFFFSPKPDEKQALLQKAADDVLEALKPFGDDGEGSVGKERARLLYVRGRALDVFSWYSEEATAFLSRAVKLNPADTDAWDALGHCFWKKGDLKQAQDCFLEAIAKRPNAKSLQQLSMLLRQLPATGGELAAKIQESIQRAREALAMGLENPESWYVLGNAHATNFFRVTHAVEDLDKALQAYGRAEANGGEGNPDLHFNRAKVLQYKQDYAAAAAGYRSALAIDPLLPASDALRDIEHGVARLADLVTRKGRMKPRKLSQLVAPLATAELPTDLERASVSSLQEGPNPGKALALRLVMPAGGPRDALPPEQIVVADATGTCAVLALYHLDRAACGRLQARDVLVVREPYLRRVGIGINSTPGTAAAATAASAAAAAAAAAASTAAAANGAESAATSDENVKAAESERSAENNNFCDAGIAGAGSVGSAHSAKGAPTAVAQKAAPASDSEVGTHQEADAAAPHDEPASDSAGSDSGGGDGAAGASKAAKRLEKKALARLQKQLPPRPSPVPCGLPSYLCIQVEHPSSLLLNGEALASSFRSAELRLSHFDK